MSLSNKSHECTLYIFLWQNRNEALSPNQFLTEMIHFVICGSQYSMSCTVKYSIMLYTVTWTLVRMSCRKINDWNKESDLYYFIYFNQIPSIKRKLMEGENVELNCSNLLMLVSQPTFISFLDQYLFKGKNIGLPLIDLRKTHCH